MGTNLRAQPCQQLLTLPDTPWTRAYIAPLPRVGDGVGEVLDGTRNVGHRRVEEAVGEELVDGREGLSRDGPRDALRPDHVQEGGEELVGVDIVEGEGGGQLALQIEERLQEGGVQRIRGPLRENQTD